MRWQLRICTLVMENPMIDKKNAMDRLGNDAQLYRRLLRRFYYDQKDSLAALNNMLTAGETQSAYRLAHTLAGSAALIGATRLSQVAHELEHALFQPSETRTSLLLLTLSDVFNTSMCEAKAEIDTDAAAHEVTARIAFNEKTATVREDIVALFQTLMPLLQTGDARCRTYLDALQEYQTGSAGFFDRLITQIDDYDFDEAYETLLQLKLLIGK